ncbi:hypothetical protein M405DRAFT_804682 [Rhizopogon salebrosus TDB-379]|nr:hypothetical protein M405DRAFT_804682 [Rhizopogon salebrosus TDB-379]
MSRYLCRCGLLILFPRVSLTLLLTFQIFSLPVQSNFKALNSTNFPSLHLPILTAHDHPR